ncbi:AAA family ATPase [Salinicoccus sp. HZC-1]|uniref:AAA family ATPase n=1 Tax=Salinicoccus sp. HZC-1 TaxID=3385497 RepID=UPI00398A5D81
MRRTGKAVEEVHDLEPQILDALYNSAKSILNVSEKRELGTVLFTSVNDDEGTITAASHISYILTQLEKKVLLVNLDLNKPDGLNYYFETSRDRKLIETISASSYLSEAIQQTQYENLEVITIEDVEEPAFIDILNTKNIKAKLNPLKNYYDLVLLIGPEAEQFEHYSNIFELAESAVTVSKDETSDYRKVKRHIDKLGLFNMVSFGIIRNSK